MGNRISALVKKGQTGGWLYSCPNMETWFLLSVLIAPIVRLAARLATKIMIDRTERDRDYRAFFVREAAGHKNQ